MKLTTLLGAIGFAVLNGVAAFAQSGTVHFDRKIETDHVNWDPLYSVYLPAGYETGERFYPVIYLLPGGGEQTHNDWFIRGRAAETLDRLIESGEMPPAIVVSPDPRRTNRPEFNTYYLDDSDGTELWETMFFADFVPEIESRYRVLEGEEFRGAVGISMGGYAALIYTYRHPEFFSAVAAMSPAIRTDDQILEMDQPGWDRRYGQTWGVGLEGQARLHERYYADSVFRKIEETQGADERPATSILIDTGADDVFFEGSVLLHRLLRTPGPDERTLESSHRFMIREGGHDWEYWRAGLPEALRFVGTAFENE